MKILILSPFTNITLREHLTFRDYHGITKRFIKRIGHSRHAESFIDAAPWVGFLIDELEKMPDVELYSVSPQNKLKKKTEVFRLGRTTYYFYSSDFSSALRLLRNYSLWKFFQNCTRLVYHIAKQVNPDVIIAYGTENPVVSVPILKLGKNYPVLCVLQTIYNNPERAKYGSPDVLKQRLERDIVKHNRYFGTEDSLYFDLLKGMNPDVLAFDYPYPRAHLPVIEKQSKEFDFVNFAFNMGARKGDEDSIRALSLVKKKFPLVTLNLAGGISPARMDYLTQLVKDLGLIENVTFTPMFERKEDMYRHILHARFALLPVKLDLVSTTIRESMYYKLPIITNITPGTPFLNRENECVLLAEMGNVDSLANQMCELLADSNHANTLASNAYDYIIKEMDNTAKMAKIMSVLKAIKSHFHDGIPVSDELLYKKEEV